MYTKLRYKTCSRQLIIAIIIGKYLSIPACIVTAVGEITALFTVHPERNEIVNKLNILGLCMRPSVLSKIISPSNVPSIVMNKFISRIRIIFMNCIKIKMPMTVKWY